MSLILEHRSVISSPVFDSGNNLYFSANCGEVQRIESGSVETFVKTDGCPRGLGFCKKGFLYICDQFHKSVLKYDTKTQEIEELVTAFEGRKFVGPNALCVDKNGTIYFTDSGPLGETSLQYPKGSVFYISTTSLTRKRRKTVKETEGEDDLADITVEGEDEEENEVEGEEDTPKKGMKLLQLHPMALNCLAYPYGITLSKDEKAVFVCETMKNRILRFVQKPSGVFHFSVFYQFSGRLGPTAITTRKDTGTLFVAHFDFQNVVDYGSIISISETGALKKRFRVGGPEISGLRFDKNGSSLFVTEDSSKSLFKIPIKEKEEDGEADIEESESI